MAYNTTMLLQCRYEQLELCGIVTVLSLALVLSYQLYLSMVDDWQEIPQQRWRVLMLSLTLLLMSIATCLYMCRRLQPIVRLPPPPVSVRGVTPASLHRKLSKLVFWFCRLVLQSVNNQPAHSRWLGACGYEYRSSMYHCGGWNLRSLWKVTPVKTLGNK